MSIPNDPLLLMSYINTKLRDYYKNLDLLCDDMELDKTELCSKLALSGYIYISSQNQFRKK